MTELDGDKLVICMRAIPGSGKTTFAKKILKDFESQDKKVLILSADNYFYNLGGGVYKFDFRHLPKAHGDCFRQFIEALQSNSHNVVIVDNTNLRSSELSPYKLGADAYGYSFIIKEVLANQEEAFARNQHGVSEFGHQGMHRTMLNESLPPWWEKETYRSVPGSNNDPRFDLVPKNTEEEEKSLTDKYSSQLDKNFKRAIQNIKYKK